MSHGAHSSRILECMPMCFWNSYINEQKCIGVCSSYLKKEFGGNRCRQWTSLLRVHCRGNGSIYLHRSGPLLENGLDRPENCYGRYAFASFSSISISTVGLGVPDVSRERRCLQTSPEQLKATKDKKDQKLEFPSPGGSGVSR